MDHTVNPKTFDKGQGVTFIDPFEGNRLEATVIQGPIRAGVWLRPAGGSREKTEGYLLRRKKGDKSFRFVSTEMIDAHE